MFCRLNAALVLLAVVLVILTVTTTVLPQDRSPRIAGKVVDNNGEPISNVKISLKGKEVDKSEINGDFQLRLGEADSRVALTFAADGYVSTTKIYDSKATGNSNTVALLPIGYRVKFDASRPLDIELGKSRIKIPGNVLTEAGGGKLKDLAVLSFTLFDITNRQQQDAAPGDFSGQMKDGSFKSLDSFGIFDFDLKNLKGQRLSLSREAKIDLFIAVPPELADDAPKQVGFFNFDENNGRWIQVGNFDFDQRTLTYNGPVTSFGGARNLDNPRDTTCVTIQVINKYDGSSMPNFSVTAHGQQGTFSGTTNSSGFVCLLVQRNATFTVSASGMLGGSSWATPIQPTFLSPNLSSGAADCGKNCTSCPMVGTVPVDFITGTGWPRRFRNGR